MEESMRSDVIDIYAAFRADPQLSISVEHELTDIWHRTVLIGEKHSRTLPVMDINRPQAGIICGQIHFVAQGGYFSHYGRIKPIFAIPDIKLLECFEIIIRIKHPAAESAIQTLPSGS